MTTKLRYWVVYKYDCMCCGHFEYTKEPPAKIAKIGLCYRCGQPLIQIRPIPIMNNADRKYPPKVKDQKLHP
jgi:hypothetical protein